MATTKAPLFGLDASGTLGGSIVFSKWRGRTYVRRHAIPSNPQSVLQVGMRSVFKFVTQDFSTLSASQKAEWDGLAAPDNITQLNAQIRDAQQRARLNLGWRQGPDEAAGVTPDNCTALAGESKNKGIILTWTRPAVNKGDYCTAIYVNPDPPLSGTIDQLRAVIDVTLETVTINNLVNGTAYRCNVLEMNTDGEFGALAVEVIITPAA